MNKDQWDTSCSNLRKILGYRATRLEQFVLIEDGQNQYVYNTRVNNVIAVLRGSGGRKVALVRRNSFYADLLERVLRAKGRTVAKSDNLGRYRDRAMRHIN